MHGKSNSLLLIIHSSSDREKKLIVVAIRVPTKVPKSQSNSQVSTLWCISKKADYVFYDIMTINHIPMKILVQGIMYSGLGARAFAIIDQCIQHFWNEATIALQRHI